MYQMIRKSGIGEWAEPIYYRQVIAHFYVKSLSRHKISSGSHEPVDRLS